MIYEYGEPQWNIDRGRPKNSEKTPSQCHFVHDKKVVQNKGQKRMSVWRKRK
jgi:hypothetical protein